MNQKGRVVRKDRTICEGKVTAEVTGITKAGRKEAGKDKERVCGRKKM